MRSLVLAFVFGVWLLQSQPILPAWEWLVAAIPLAVFCFSMRRRAIAFRFCTLTLALFAGFLWAASMAHFRLADALNPAWEGQDIQMVGVVASLPQMQERGERFLFDVDRVETPDATVPRRISITRYFAGYRQSVLDTARSEFHPGERWRLTVRLKRPHGTYNPHGFDFEIWALERNIRATGYIRKSDANVRLEPMVYHPAYLVEHLREGVRARFQSVLRDSPYVGVLRALAIGDDDAISSDDWELFRRSGTVHLMSISGFHVTMVAGLVFVLVYAIWRRIEALVLRLPARKAATLAGLAAAGAYALLAGFAVPTQRTFYMLAVLAAALWSGRAVSMSLVLCWALLIVVVLDPWAVLAPGFWLSFGAVALLGYAGNNRLTRPGWLRESARAQWVVTLGLVPLLLALFQQISLVSPLANAFAIPLISLVVTPLTLLGAVIPVDAILHAAHTVMVWCMSLLKLGAGLPLAVWQQHAPPIWAVLAAIGGVLWMLLPRGFPMRWLGGTALAPMFLLLPVQPLPGELRVAVLDVGQGLAVVVQTARHALLYDAGPRYSEDADSGSRVILPYLRGAGVARLDGMVVTHDDVDHTGGVASVTQGMPVAWLASPLPENHPLTGLAAKDLWCYAGQSWDWDNVRFEMLHPVWESYAAEGMKDNDLSCVLKVTSRHGSLLLTGDMERVSELELLERSAASLAADVLVVPHHGSKTSSTEGFIAQINPKVAVFTVGYRNRFGHPKPEIVQRYRDLGSDIYRSDLDGAVLFGFTRTSGLGVETWRQAKPRYWHERTVGVAQNNGSG
jgi:competence protein ComEC